MDPGLLTVNRYKEVIDRDSETGDKLAGIL